MAVKEPWEVFVDALREQLARHDADVGTAGGFTKVPEADIPRMSTAMANVVLHHLTSVEGLGQGQALEVTKLFFAELSKPSSEPLRRRLKGVWDGWKDS